MATVIPFKLPSGTRTPTKPAPEERNARRAVVLTQSPEARLAALSLLPPTPLAMSGHLTTQLALVRQLASSPAAHDQLSFEMGKLVALVAASRAVRDPSSVGVGPVVHVVPALAQAKLRALQAQQALLARKEQELLAAASKVGSAATRASLAQQAALVAAQRKEAAARIQLLAKGRDLNKPVRVLPAQVSRQRKPITLPTHFVLPTKGDVVMATSILTAAYPAIPNESPATRRIKLRGLIERLLARLVAKGDLSTATVQATAKETVAEDGPIIAAEVAETGGLVQDNAAQAFDPLLEEASQEIDRAAVATAGVPVPIDPSPKEIATAIALAEQEIVADTQAPTEAWDDMRADIVQAEQILPTTPFWQKPRVVASAGALVLLGIFLARSR